LGSVLGALAAGYFGVKGACGSLALASVQGLDHAGVVRAPQSTPIGQDCVNDAR